MVIPKSDGTRSRLPRYERVPENTNASPPTDIVSPENLADVIANSSLSDGARELLRALLRTGRTRQFPGGGIGIEYGALLKSATRPDLFARHISEVVAHLKAAAVDLLVVPGMSGYPIGALYSQASGIPALLLKKQNFPDESPAHHSPGSFLIPSYTGSGDTLISADPVAATTSCWASSTAKSKPKVQVMRS